MGDIFSVVTINFHGSVTIHVLKAKSQNLPVGSQAKTANRKQGYILCSFGLILSESVTSGSSNTYARSGPAPFKAGKSCMTK